MPPRESGPTSLNRNKKLHFSLPRLKERPSESVYLSRISRDHEARRQVRLAVRRGRLRRRRRRDHGAGTTENLPEADTRRRSSRLPWHVLRVDQVRDHRADEDVGAVAVLRPFYLRARRRQFRPSVRAGGGLRPAAQGQPQVQALRKDQQDRELPRLLSDLRVRGRRQARIPGYPDPAAADRCGSGSRKRATGSGTESLSR